MPALQVQAICKSYNGTAAVDHVSFAISEGTMFGLLGPNGAGKTSTMRMILNIILPDSGKITLWGEPFREEFKNRIGYLPEERGLYPGMKLRDHLQFLGELKGMASTAARRAAGEWLEAFGLAAHAASRIKELSKGMQQKAQFIGTVIHSPGLLILDEPFSGLDPVNTRFIKDVMLKLKSEGTTIILSTHLIDQAEKLCDDICLIHHGRVVLQDSLRNVLSSYSQNSVIVEYQGDGSFLPTLPMIETLNDYGNFVEIRLRAGSRPGELFRALSAADIEVQRFETARPSLNEIFIEIIEGQNGQQST